MDNNDVLIRLRFALDIKDKDMIDIFKKAGYDFTKEDIRKVLTKSKDADEFEDDFDEVEEDDNQIKCNNAMLESFLNGFITFKRGPKPGSNELPPLTKEKVNNMVLKKIKIALALTTDDIVDILALAGVWVSNSEISALLRKAGHKNYKECGDKFARNFLKGLAIKYRDL